MWRVGWGGNLTPLLTHRATPAQPTTPPTFSIRTGQQLPQPLLVNCEGLEGKQGNGISAFRPSRLVKSHAGNRLPPPPTPRDNRGLR